MPHLAKNEFAAQPMIADQIMKVDEYIAHTKATICSMQSSRTRPGSAFTPQADDDEVMSIVLKVLKNFEEHRQILLILQERDSDITPYWIPAAKSGTSGLNFTSSGK